MNLLTASAIVAWSWKTGTVEFYSRKIEVGA